MNKIFGKKKDRPSSASDSTLRVPPSPIKGFSSTERMTTSTSYSSRSTTSTKVTSTSTAIVDYGGTFPRQAYKPVYERTQEWSNKFDRGAPFRHSTTPGTNVFAYPPRKASVPSGSYQPLATSYARSSPNPVSSVSYQPTTTAFTRPPPSPLTRPSTQTDATPFKITSTLFNSPHRRPVNPLDLENVLHVKVTKCRRPVDHTQSKIPSYSTNSKGKRGSLLVINNMKFQKHEKERKGAEKDVRNMDELFRQMNFERTIKSNLIKKDMESTLKAYSKKNFNQFDVNVIVMMSHGCGDSNSDSTKIIGTDGQSLATTEVISYFTNSNCPSLAGKPKIFIFQCCRGNQERIYTDAKSILIPSEGDMLLAYATIPGFVSYREEFIGSWYIQAICKVFMANAHDTHVEDMLKMVDGALANKAGEHNRAQTSSYENRGFKCCYLNPI